MTYAQFPAGFNYQLQNSGQFATGSDVRSGNTESFTVQITGTQLAASLNVPPNSQVFVTSPDPSIDNRPGAVIISSGFGPAITGVQTGYQTGDAATIALDPNQSLNGTLVISTSVVTPGQQFTLPNNTPQTFSNLQQAPCFTTGTLIRTARGEVAVEDLRVGDLAVTASGTLRPITWIGNRALDAKGEALPHNEQPVRIRAGAFGPGLPARDLRLSHGHPVLVGADANGDGGVLVPVMCLINGTSVLREPATQVTYWHIELDAHDILLAEGLAAESYYDMGSRVWFAGEDGMLTDPDFVPAGEHGRCRPVAVGGALVEAERQRLDAVFAAELDGHGAWTDADAWHIA
ncbi:Hint domain-containing protein [Methylorubrum extorquens]|uniref:Hint domain-containing protein n=1 Tax=Methylorubrum extorquens TaxID=408 RepID=UPI0022387F2A|nr:Hint domain-containing protein [Methylorubrum extorquens]UYW29644.1 Hint domain-containing protein [Methylorubrum extorquens]